MQPNSYYICPWGGGTDCPVCHATQDLLPQAKVLVSVLQVLCEVQSRSYPLKRCPVPLNCESPISQEFQLPDAHPRQRKLHSHTETHARMFTAALFLTAKTWAQPTRPSTGGWVTRCGPSTRRNGVQPQKGMKPCLTQLRA